MHLPSVSIPRLYAPTEAGKPPLCLSKRTVRAFSGANQGMGGRAGKWPETIYLECAHFVQEKNVAEWHRGTASSSTWSLRTVSPRFSFREWSLTKINGHFAHVLSALGKAESQALWLSVGGLLADAPQTIQMTVGRSQQMRCGLLNFI